MVSVSWDVTILIGNSAKQSCQGDQQGVLWEWNLDKIRCCREAEYIWFYLNGASITQVFVQFSYYKIIKIWEWLKEQIYCIITKYFTVQRRCYENISNEYHRTNIIQLALLILGLIFLFFSSLISESSIWKEVLLIIGWVPIWEMVDLELFKDYRGRRKKKIIAKLLSSDFIENKKN